MKKLYYVSVLFVAIVFSCKIITQGLDTSGNIYKTPSPQIFQDIQDIALDKSIRDNLENHIIYFSNPNTIYSTLILNNYSFQLNLSGFIPPTDLVLRI